MFFWKTKNSSEEMEGYENFYLSSIMDGGEMGD